MLRKGDVVTIRGIVKWDVGKDEKRFSVSIESAIDYVTVDVAAVTVFQQDIRVGDRVTYNDAVQWPPAKVIAIDGDDVFARDDIGTPLLWKRQELTRVDDEGGNDNGVD